MEEDICKPYYKGFWETTKRVSGELGSVFTCSFSYLLSPLARYIVYNSKNYKELVNRVSCIEEEKAGLEAKLTGEVKLRDELCGDLKAKEEQLNKIQADFLYNNRKAEKLELELVNLIPEAKKILLEAKNVVHSLTTNSDIKEMRFDAIKEMASEVKSYNKALEEWKKKELEPYKKRTELAEKRAATYRGFVFNEVVNSCVIDNSRMKNIPFAYYDFGNKRLLCTHATLKLFNLHQTNKKLTLLGLLNYVRKADLADNEERKGIIYSIRKGVALRHYEARTTGQNPTSLRLTTYPLFYNDKPQGVGIFLYDNKYTFRSLRFKLIGKKLENLFEEYKKRFINIEKSINPHI